MLGRRVGAVLLLLSVYVIFTPAAAHADYIYCPPDNGPCYIRVGNPGGPGGPGSGGGGGGGGSGSALMCYLPEARAEIPCYRSTMGWFNHRDNCYYDKLDLSIDDPLWNGNDPTKGDVYAVRCWHGAAAGWVLERHRYLTSEPPGYGGQPTPISVATDAINLLPMLPPDLGIAPGPSSAGYSGLVGLPVWMWTRTDTNRTWVPNDASKLHRWVQDQGVRVDAWAYSSRITWFMGDGTQIDCYNPGEAYTSAKWDSASTSCGHVYKSSSRGQTGGVFPVRAVTSWEVYWEGGGRSASLTIYRESSTTVRINELQVVTE